jgi:hypothetical protein
MPGSARTAQKVSRWRSVRTNEDGASAGGVSSSTQRQKRSCSLAGRSPAGGSGSPASPSTAAASARAAPKRSRSMLSRWPPMWVHVVPHFGGVLITMSPGRSRTWRQRALS